MLYIIPELCGNTGFMQYSSMNSKESNIVNANHAVTPFTACNIF